MMDPLMISEEDVKEFVGGKLREYKSFMKISDDCFPEYNFTKGLSSQNGLGTLNGAVSAKAKYDLESGRYSLSVIPQIVNDKSDGVLFHEFTHLLDFKKYYEGNTDSVFKFNGYTEYHAAQMELLRIIGAKSFDEKVNFSMNLEREVGGSNVTIRDYVSQTFGLAQNVERLDFVKTFANLDNALGILCNYFGRRSICKMFSIDYNPDMDEQDLSSLASYYAFAREDPVAQWDALFNGFLTQERIEQVSDIYYKTICYHVEELLQEVRSKMETGCTYEEVVGNMMLSFDEFDEIKKLL